MSRSEQKDCMIGVLRTLAAAAGILLLALAAAPGAFAAGTQPAVPAAGGNGTVIWGLVFALAALGIITAEIVHKKRPARRDSRKG